ncbi:MAG: hypothetical protein JWO75_2779 [Actinomycetia bacterium]|nr:hypothetical protein [Actinomycetes bacterium]
MPAESALASRGPVDQEESAIQLISLTDVWPPLDQEPAAGDEPARPSCAQPPAHEPSSVLPRKFAVFLIECLAGVRPARQLMPWLSKRGSVHLHRLMPLFAGGHQPRVLRVLTARPAPDVIEMTLVVVTGPRTRALAVRLERSGHPKRWLCTDIEAALTAGYPACRGSPWQRLYLRPEPQGHMSLRPTLAKGSSAATPCISTPPPSAGAEYWRLRGRCGSKSAGSTGCGPVSSGTVSVTPASAPAGSAARASLLRVAA